MLTRFKLYGFSDNSRGFVLCIRSCFRKLYWADQGGYGVPPKIGKINMDGSNPQVLINEGHAPEAIAIDLEQKNIYYSTQYPTTVNQININFYKLKQTNK